MLVEVGHQHRGVGYSRRRHRSRDPYSPSRRRGYPAHPRSLSWSPTPAEEHARLPGERPASSYSRQGFSPEGAAGERRQPTSREQSPLTERDRPSRPMRPTPSAAPSQRSLTPESPRRESRSRPATGYIPPRRDGSLSPRRPIVLTVPGRRRRRRSPTVLGTPSQYRTRTPTPRRPSGKPEKNHSLYISELFVRHR